MRTKTQAMKEPANLDLSTRRRELMLTDVEKLLSQAAERAVRLDLNLDTFMQAAHFAYLQASPATRERLEAAQMSAHFDDLRRRGVLASA